MIRVGREGEGRGWSFEGGGMIHRYRWDLADAVVAFPSYTSRRSPGICNCTPTNVFHAVGGLRV